ncbi:MAG: dienelactone hydrolase family protein [Acidimicrobiia bacterium]
MNRSSRRAAAGLTLAASVTALTCGVALAQPQVGAGHPAPPATHLAAPVVGRSTPQAERRPGRAESDPVEQGLGLADTPTAPEPDPPAPDVALDLSGPRPTCRHVPALGGCPVEDLAAGPDPAVVDVESELVVIPGSWHGQDLPLPAQVFRPQWSDPNGPGAAVLVLHGSGGLHQMPEGKGKGKGDRPCADELEEQYQEWGDRLAQAGYLVLMPSSYEARGFCDAHEDLDRIPETMDSDAEVVVNRIYDLDSASRYLCAMAEVDCTRLGVVGFSQGGTMAMLALHWQLDHALDRFRADHGEEVDVVLPDLAPGRPGFEVGVSFYPGCGTSGVISTSTSPAVALEDKYLPTADLTILHGSEDPLVELCSTDHGSGARQVQSAQVAEALGTPDPYDIVVYPGAGHGFDQAQPGPNATEGDLAAREAARAVALDVLAGHLG